MRGLLQRGLEIRRRIAAQASPEDEELDSTISEEDRQEILAEIERVTAANRIRVEDGAFQVSPIHKRAYFPLFVNIVSVLVLAVGLFGLYRFFEAQERAVSRRAEAVVSGEARLIRQLQEESQQRIQQKEQEITSIQDRLRRIAEEREAIEENMEAQIQAREQELLEEFERRRVAEENRLADQGLSAAEIEERMRRLQAQQEAELADALAEARSEAEAERERLAANLADLQSEYDQALRSAEAEQAALRRQAEERAAELEAEYGEQLSQTMGELERLAIEQQQADRVRTQIAGYYDAVQQDMRAGKYGDALVTLDALRSYLFEPTVEQVAAVAERRPTELFVISSLQDLIEQEQTEAEADTQALLASAQLVGTVSQLATEAASALERGERARAAELYSRALEVLPSALESHQFLVEERTSRLRTEHASEMRDQLAAASQETERRIDAARLEARAIAEAEAQQRLEAALEQARRTADEELEIAVATATAEAAAQAAAEARASIREEAEARLESALAEAARAADARLEAAVAEAIAETRREARRSLEDREAELGARIADLETAISELRRELQQAERLATSQSEALAEARARIGTDTRRIETLTEQVSELSKSVESLNREKDDIAARFDAVIRSLRQRVESSSARALGTDGAPRELSSLLGTTVTLRRVLSSEFVRSQYPTLYEDTDQYLVALAAESRQHGRREALDEVLSVVTALESGADAHTVLADLDLEANDNESLSLIVKLLGHMRDITAPSRE